MSVTAQVMGLERTGRLVRARGLDSLPAVAKRGSFTSPRGVSSGTEIPHVNRSDDIQLIRTDGVERGFLEGLGARRTRSGWWMPRQTSGRFPFDQLGEMLPRYARRNVVPYVVDLIPRTAWHASLNNILMKSSWDALREETAARSGGCEECGIRTGIECHEFWSYDQALRVQRLISLEALCWQCHETRHLGFADMRGRLTEVFDRLCVINRIMDEERREYLDLINALFRYRSEFEWSMDVSVLAGRGMKVKKAVEHQGAGRLRGRAGDRVVDFRLVETRFDATPKGVVIL